MKTISLALFAMLAGGFISLATANADPSFTCPDGNVPGTNYGQCQWWRNGPMNPNESGTPGTWGPSNMGPSWYTPCYNDYKGGC